LRWQLQQNSLVLRSFPYESNMPGNEPCLYLPLPGVREDVVFWVPREARFVWPEELRLAAV